jgi:hypothetical protein
MAYRAAEMVANLVMTLVVKGVLTFAEAQAILGVTDADMLAHTPPGTSAEQAIEYIALAHQLTEEER